MRDMQFIAAVVIINLSFFLFCAIFDNIAGALQISYDHRGLLFDGQPKLLISGSIHYPRSTPQMWPDLISNAKEGGLNVIETYVFWNAHEPDQGRYNFEDNLDVVKFMKLVKEAGLFVNLRIGPFIEAEWNFGGLPIWLRLQDGVTLRTNNKIYMNAMQNFTTKIVQMMKEENLFAWQGGPIIMAQIENEFGAAPINSPSYEYMMWAANMAMSLDIGVPWIMCKQPDAPDHVIDTYNGAINGATFQPNSPYKPKMWTEIYTAWFQTYGKAQPRRSEQNIAFEVTRFTQTNGSFFNYYMYHGGTNFGRTSGGPFITTSYDYDAPIDEYGLLNQPKWGHLKFLHQALKLCESALISGSAPNIINTGSYQDVFIFSNGTESCAAFLSNLDPQNDATVKFNDYSYNLPAQSISILPDCKTVAFNTAKVLTQINTMQMLPVSANPITTSVHGQPIASVTWNGSWEWYNEPVATWNETVSVTPKCCPEQIRTTRDKTDYLWYIISFEVPDGGQANLDIASLGHAGHLFVNGEYIVTFAGNHDNPHVQAGHTIKLQRSTNEIAILSMTVGLQSGVRAGRVQDAGIQGPVTLKGLDSGGLDLSSQPWKYQTGLQGELLQLYSDNPNHSVKWLSGPSPPQNQLVWYKMSFDAPPGNSPVALDLITMGKGQAWVNGRNIGRYWPSYNVSNSGCSRKCGPTQTRCYIGCGQSSQRWYHVPRAWLKPTSNLLVLFEEVGGDPMGITLVTRSTATICSSISEDYPAPLDLWVSNSKTPLVPEVRLECNAGEEISSILFASYGTPRGSCSSLRKGPCHAKTSSSVVKQACLGKSSCAVQVLPETFGGDPCPDHRKTLAIIAACSPTT